MKVVKLLIPAIILISILTACGNASSNQQDDSNPKIYTTIYPLQYLVEEIAGDTFNVETVYPPGVDEHTYEPTAKELTQIAEGEAFFYIGANLEAIATTAASALENQEVALIEIGAHEELFLEGDHRHHEENHGHDHGDVDPHIWLDPVRMLDMAAIVKEELTELNPEASEQYEENFITLENELHQLHEEFQQLTDGVENPSIIVTHAAFGYWENRYGIEQISIHGISTENEPSQKELIRIIETAEELELSHIVFEQNVTSRVAEVIQEEIDAEPMIIHNLAVRTEEDIREGRDYLSIMRDNMNVLEEILHEQ